MSRLKRVMNNFRKQNSSRRQGTSIDSARSCESRTAKELPTNTNCASSKGKAHALDSSLDANTPLKCAPLNKLNRRSEGGQERATVGPDQVDSEKNNWSVLASDVIFCLRKWLTQEEALSVRLVNKHWSIAGRSFITRVNLCDGDEFTSSPHSRSSLRYFTDESFHQLRHLKISQFKEEHDSLSCLTKLHSLNVSWWFAEVPQFAALQALVNLTSLKLGWTQLKDEGMQYISGLTNLTTLSLQWCHLTETSISCLAPITNLSHLSLSGLLCTTEDCLHPLQSLKKLSRLDLSGMNLSGRALRPLSSLTNLTDLNLSANDITSESLEDVAGLCYLKRLDLSRTNVDNEGLTKLTTLQRLRHLNLSASYISDQGLHILINFRFLSKLDLSYNFMLCSNNLECLMPMTRLTSLRWINLERTQATATDVKMFLAAMKARSIIINY